MDDVLTCLPRVLVVVPVIVLRVDTLDLQLILLVIGPILFIDRLFVTERCIKKQLLGTKPLR